VLQTGPPEGHFGPILGIPWLGFGLRKLGFGFWKLGFDLGILGFGLPELGFEVSVWVRGCVGESPRGFGFVILVVSHRGCACMPDR